MYVLEHVSMVTSVWTSDCDQYEDGGVIERNSVFFISSNCFFHRVCDRMAFCFHFISRLCVAALSVNSFCGSREALYGVFDGDRNVEVPYLLQCTMNDVLAEELHKTKSEEDYMTNTFLVMQR